MSNSSSIFARHVQDNGVIWKDAEVEDVYRRFKSIAVMIDIVKSQHLMIHTDPEEAIPDATHTEWRYFPIGRINIPKNIGKGFGAWLSYYHLVCKRFCKFYGGVYDHFTGDGIVCHFNGEIIRHIINRVNEERLKVRSNGDIENASKSAVEPFEQMGLRRLGESSEYANGMTAVNQAIAFIAEINRFSKEYFSKWEKVLVEVPSQNIGIRIGMDYGPITLNFFEGEMYAYGTPLVWANRVAQKAPAGSIRVNNRLMSLLELYKPLRELPDDEKWLDDSFLIRRERIPQKYGDEGFELMCHNLEFMDAKHSGLSASLMMDLKNRLPEEPFLWEKCANMNSGRDHSIPVRMCALFLLPSSFPWSSE